MKLTKEEELMIKERRKGNPWWLYRGVAVVVIVILVSSQMEHLMSYDLVSFGIGSGLFALCLLYLFLDGHVQSKKRGKK